MARKATKAQADALRERGELAPNMRFNGTRYETIDDKPTSGNDGEGDKGGDKGSATNNG